MSQELCFLDQRLKACEPSQRTTAARLLSVLCCPVLLSFALLISLPMCAPSLHPLSEQAARRKTQPPAKFRRATFSQSPQKLNACLTRRSMPGFHYRSPFLSCPPLQPFFPTSAPSLVYVVYFPRLMHRS